MSWRDESRADLNGFESSPRGVARSVTEPVDGTRVSRPLGATRPAPAVEMAGSPGHPRTEAELGRAASGRERVFAVGGGVAMVTAIVSALLVFQPLSHQYSGAADGAERVVVRPTPTKTTTPQGPITPPGPIASITGTVVDSTARAFADVVALHFLTGDQVAIYRSTGPITDVDFALAHQGSNRIVTVLVRRESAAAATLTTNQMAALMTNYGMVGRASGRTGVHIQAADKASGGPLRRVEYTSGPHAVYLEVQGPTAQGVDTLMTAALTAQLITLPAS